MSREPLPAGVTYDRGFRLPGTPLGFQGTVNPGLLFFANIDQRPPRTEQRILSTPTAAAAVGAIGRGLDTMGLAYERKVRLGKMDIRLLPSGFGPGGALLEVAYKDRVIVFCDGIRLARPLHSTPAIVPTCDLLLIDTACAEPRPPSPRTVAKELAAWAKRGLEGGVPVVTCGSPSAAVDAAWALKDLEAPVTAARPIYEMLSRLETVGYDFPRLRRLNQEWPGEGLVLHWSHLWTYSRFFKEADAVAFAGQGRTAPRWATASFRAGEREDRSGLSSFARQTGAGTVVLGPRCDEATASLLRRSGLNVSHLESPKQMRLPL